MKKGVLDTRAIAEIAIFAAIAFILDFIQEKVWGFAPFFANGGSIGFAMVPIIIIALRRGVICGGICGLITGLLQMLGGVTAISSDWYRVFLQILLDYTITYMMVGLLAGIGHHFLDANKSKGYNIGIVCLATLVGGLGKFFCHFLAGVLFWPKDEIFDMSVSAAMYSFIYNGLYCFPNIIICIIVFVILYSKAPKFFYIEANGGRA